MYGESEPDALDVHISLPLDTTFAESAALLDAVGWVPQLSNDCSIMS